MKVSKCNGEKAPEKIVSYAEMARDEGGVYRRAHKLADVARWIVVDDGVVLIYDVDTIFTSIRSLWNDVGFVRTNETVCFELKAG